MSRAISMPMGNKVQVTGAEPIIGTVAQPKPASMDEQRRLVCVQLAVQLQRCVDGDELIATARKIHDYLTGTI